jgi:hypothetical protein
MMMDGLLLPVAPVWMLRLSWAVVAAAVVWWWLSSVIRRVHPSVETRPGRRAAFVEHLPKALAMVVALLAVWPQGGWSGYAALAFQSPSLVSLVWALGWLMRSVSRMNPARKDNSVPVAAWYLLCLLGWGLVVDTLNLWPSAWDVSLYGIGFSASGLWVSACLVLVLAWRQSGMWVWSAIGVMMMYAVLRWPSGNVWDAWLDPAVWIVAHVQIVRHALVRVRAWRVSGS